VTSASVLATDVGDTPMRAAFVNQAGEILLRRSTATPADVDAAVHQNSIERRKGKVEPIPVESALARAGPKESRCVFQ